MILPFPRRLGKSKLHTLNLRENKFGPYEFLKSCDVILGNKILLFLCVLSTCQTAKVWAMDMIFIYILYLGNLASAGKNCYFYRKKKRFFFKSSDFEHVPNCQALNDWANFSMFFYLTNLQHLWKSQLDLILSAETRG